MQTSRAPVRSKGSGWPLSPPLTIFVRNLKLLQLDQQPDWPDITVRSLSPSHQNQRQRIRGVEWGLYYLFAIWDPEGTHNKLRPFFPPLEPLQSLNLRAALFRALSDVKKNGDLGREAILRKTMLDDCKGEKFEEILAVFSTAVLRRVLATGADLTANPVMRLATAKGTTPEDYQSMVPLILAHQWSLTTMAEGRTRVRSNYEKFTKLVEAKKEELAARSSETRKQPENGGVHYEHLSRELRANWLASEEWADALLDGGSRSSTDGFLELPFADAWSLANRETAEDQTNAPAADLLVDLESRLSRQRARLNKWREFNKSIQNPEVPQRAAERNHSDAPRLVFREHQSLTVASVSKAMRKPAGSTVQSAGYQSLLSSMNDALSKLKGQVDLPGRPVIREAATWEDDHGPSPSTLLSPMPAERESLLQSPRISITSAEHDSRPPTPLAEDTEMLSLGDENPDEADSHVDASSREGDPSSGTGTPEPELGPLPTMKPKLESRPNAITLVERTRQSMSLLPPPNSRPQSRPARQPRPSFPVNQFQTPRKPSRSPSPDISRASTPRDELFDQDAEYNSVFKSRPRIATSPIFSPMVHVQPVEDVDMDADHPGSPWDVSYGELDLQSSPLARTRA